MYQITINAPKVYQAGETFAKENHSTVWQEMECCQADLGDGDETMDLETARALVHETIHKVYAQ